MGGKVASRLSVVCGLVVAGILAVTALAFGISGAADRAVAASASPASGAMHMGVASCSGSTCHGRSEPTGKVVRQDEILIWQASSSSTGAHSRAFAVLASPRGQAIAAKMGIGPATSATECLGCHADPAPAGARGPRWQVSDGVGCEGCHGASQNWLSSHYAVGQTHASNVAKGLYPLDQPRARAEKCLDCHLGSDRPGQFVSHRIMAAGHPRVSFEVDLFSALQQHHDEDADYLRRKSRMDNVQLWAVGQASAVSRITSLFANLRLGSDGVFPEIYFFDCHSCHRQIVDGPAGKANWVANPGRPIPSGMPPFNDENMIMLSAASKVLSPGAAGKFDAASRSFHAALAKDRPSAVSAARTLGTAASALADSLSRSPVSSAQTFAIVDAIAGEAVAPRFTDYEGSAQAVMALDTLLNGLVRQGHVSEGRAKSARGAIDRAYKAVGNSNAYKPAEFRSALGQAAAAIRALK